MWHLSPSSLLQKMYVCIFISGSGEQRMSGAHHELIGLVWPIVHWQFLPQLILSSVQTFRSSMSSSFLWPCYFHRLWYATLEHLIWTFDNEHVTTITNTVLFSVYYFLILFSDSQIVTDHPALLFPILRKGAVFYLTGWHYLFAISVLAVHANYAVMERFFSSL